MRWTIGLLVVVALAGCEEHSSAPAPRKVDAGVARAAPSEAECVDAWLSAHKLDSYGGAEGTMYAGGSPLFDERTGETKDRLTYVYEKQPEAKSACHKAP